MSYDCDFESFTPGSLDGQGLWTVNGAVVGGPGPAPNATLTANGPTGIAVSEALHPLDVPFFHTSADTTILWSCLARDSDFSGNRDALAGPSGHLSGNGIVFGIDDLGGNPATTYLSALSARKGDVLQADHGYEIRVVVNS